MVERALELVRGCVQLAWWDGSSVDLRFDRLVDLFDVVAEAFDPDHTLARTLLLRGEVS